MRSRRAIRIAWVGAAVALAWAWAAGALASGAEAPGPPASAVHTNQAFIEEARGAEEPDPADFMAVFSHVLGALPATVNVYPTENYYYFWFISRGRRYAGNFNLNLADRDKGLVRFSYYLDTPQWGEGDFPHAVLGPALGVKVEREAPLAYRISYQGRSVLFRLNDLSALTPSAAQIRPGETYIGPVQDESGARFFLLFNRRLKMFLYVLDESPAGREALLPVDGADGMLVGVLSGFAYYRDRLADRKLLIGVLNRNVETNSWFDGPFDQLPDNFIQGEALRQALVAANPALAGRIDRLGYFAGGEDRALVEPYRHYDTVDDLLVVKTCAESRRVPAAQYYGCFTTDDGAKAPRAWLAATARKPKPSAPAPRSPGGRRK